MLVSREEEEQHWLERARGTHARAWKPAKGGQRKYIERRIIPVAGDFTGDPELRKIAQAASFMELEDEIRNHQRKIDEAEKESAKNRAFLGELTMDEIALEGWPGGAPFRPIPEKKRRKAKKKVKRRLS